MCPVAADADADSARRATLPLRLPNRVQDTLADAFQVAIGAAQVVQHHGHRVLDVLVLAAAALEDELDFDFVLFPLLKVNDGGLDAQVVPTVLAGQGIDRVGAEFAAVA